MKPSTFIYIMLIVGGFFFLFGQIVLESNQNFPDDQINSSEWQDQYRYTQEINDTFNPVRQKLQQVQDEDQGWFERLSAGVTAVPRAILVVPSALFEALGFGNDLIVGFFTTLNIPKVIITLAMVTLVVWGIVELIKYFNKTDF